MSIWKARKLPPPAMESQRQRQAREVLHRLLQGDLPVSLDTYPDLKTDFERQARMGWAECVLTSYHLIQPILRRLTTD
jgi:hypothetical protein